MRPTKVQIPEELKSDMPHTAFGKILSATPVVMAVVATMLAALASSEMTKAQYERSVAAQQQSKAGDQWSFFQAKRLRGSLQGNTLDLLQSMSAVPQFDPAMIKDALSKASSGVSEAQELPNFLNAKATQDTLLLLQKGKLPATPSAPELSSNVKEALNALHSPSGEKDLQNRLSKMKMPELDEAVRQAREHAQAFDQACQPYNQSVERLADLLTPLGEGPLVRSFTAARLKYASQRYEVEARLNQAVANLYELQVRKSNLTSERHHVRSQRFFFGMLAAQAGVIISTFAMAARKRNVLWSIAAGAGIIAVLFAIYVYLYV